MVISSLFFPKIVYTNVFSQKKRYELDRTGCSKNIMLLRHTFIGELLQYLERLDHGKVFRLLVWCKQSEEISAMFAMHVLQQKKYLLFVFSVIIFEIFLAACGTSSSGTAVSSTPSPTPTFAIVPGSGSTYGCPSDVVVSSTLAVPNVTIQPKQSASTVDVRKGNMLEVQMPFGVMWQGPTVSQGVLQLQQPAGYAWKPSNSCIWRFVAEQIGTVELHFFGRAICKKVYLCAPSVLDTSFTVKVG